MQFNKMILGAADEICFFETAGESCMFLQKENKVFKCNNVPGEASKKKAADKDAVRIQINKEHKYQEIDGFGASFTDSSAYLVHEVLTQQERKTVMKKLFDQEEGIGLSFVRQPIGASDYARSIYSYQDSEEDDFEFARFSIEHDRGYILPLLKEMLEIQPGVKVMATPWSAPGWMKTTGSMIGGTLRKDCYGAFAEYLIRFVEAYEEEGIPIYVISPQNEPLFVPGHYPGMGFPAADEAEFIAEFLGPLMKQRRIHTKLLCYDHNWDEPRYPLEVLQKAGDFTDGSAWHVYAASPEAQSLVQQAFPDKEIYYTEASGGEWIAPFDNAFISMMETNIGTLRNHSRTVVLWNMALDEKNGPVVPGFGESTCRGLITVNQQTKQVTYNLDYYALAHFSCAVKQGARRVESNETEEITNVVFQNPDGSMAMIACNRARKEEQVQILCGERECNFTMKPRSAVTLFWKENE